MGLYCTYRTRALESNFILKMGTVKISEETDNITIWGYQERREFSNVIILLMIMCSYNYLYFIHTPSKIIQITIIHIEKNWILCITVIMRYLKKKYWVNKAQLCIVGNVSFIARIPDGRDKSQKHMDSFHINAADFSKIVHWAHSNWKTSNLTHIFTNE